LSLLLKASPLVDELALFDIVNSPGVAADLSHINTKSVVTGYLPPDNGLETALKSADIVVIPAGVPRKVLLSLSLILSISIQSSQVARNDAGWYSANKLFQ
jgi:malate/lactate dehydrogenase